MPVVLPVAAEALAAGGEALAGGEAIAGGTAAAEAGTAATEAGTAATEAGTSTAESGGGLTSKLGKFGGGSMASSALKAVGQHEAFQAAGDALNAMGPQSTPEGRIAQMNSMLSPHQFG